MAVTDYTGRSVDLFIMQGAGTRGLRRIETGFDSKNGGQLTTGAQKVSQSFLVLFLTEKGSVAGDKEYGSVFLSRIRGSNISESQIQIIFRETAKDILDQQERYIQGDTPDDEILTAIDLLSFSSADPTSMELTIQLTTADGVQREVILPISLVIK